MKKSTNPERTAAELPRTQNPEHHLPDRVPQGQPLCSTPHPASEGQNLTDDLSSVTGLPHAAAWFDSRPCPSALLRGVPLHGYTPTCWFPCWWAFGLSSAWAVE